jgi:predicted Zn-dependent protease
MKMIVYLRKIIACALVVLLAQLCRVPSSSAFSIGEERELGEKLLYTVRSSFPLLGDPDLHQYINNLGQEVLEIAGIQFFDYRFFIVESHQFNAFAAPSGLIFFYTKLIESMNSEDELVSVIAHEIGHVAKRHLASRMKKGRAINIAALGVALAALALGGGGAASQTLLAGSMAAGQSAQLYFSRQDEAEADALAYEWLKTLQRDPEGQKRMLQTMRRITRYRSGQVPQYLLTHPDPEARLDFVESLIYAENIIPQNRPETRDFEFLRFKYRIMSLDKNNGPSRRAFFVSKLSDPRATSFEVTMAMYGLSQLDRQQNNYERSLAMIDQVIEVFPDKNILQVDRAIILAETGEYATAMKILETAMDRDSNDMYAVYNAAQILEKLGVAERAKQLYMDVSYEMPEFSDAYFAIGRVLSSMGENLESRFYLGKYNLYEGKLKLAESNFRQVVKESPQDDIREQSEEMLELIERLKKG